MNASTLYTLARLEIVAVLIAFGGFADRAAADAAPRPLRPHRLPTTPPRPSLPPWPSAIDKLVRQLGDKDYFVERAEADWLDWASMRLKRSTPPRPTRTWKSLFGRSI